MEAVRQPSLPRVHWDWSADAEALWDDPIKIGKSLVALALDTERKHDTFQKHHSGPFRERRAFRFNVVRGLEDIGLEEADKQGAILAATRRYAQAEDVYDRMEMCAWALRDRECVSVSR